jgi:hypothetical protein
LIAAGLLTIFVFGAPSERRFLLESDVVSCDDGGLCQYAVNDFDLHIKNVAVGFYYPHFESNVARFESARINLWEAGSDTTFDCGVFNKISDFKWIAGLYHSSIDHEKIGFALTDQKSLPCARENAMYLFRERVISIRDSDTEYHITGESTSNKDLQDFSSNWIDNAADYFKWARFIYSNGQNYLESGVVTSKLPKKFFVNFQKGFGNLGVNETTYLIFYDFVAPSFIALGVLLASSGLLTLLMIISWLIFRPKQRKI